MRGLADGLSVTRGVKWACHECGHVNDKGDLSCARCSHEPVLGRRDHDPEGRRFDPDRDSIAKADEAF